MLISCLFTSNSIMISYHRTFFFLRCAFALFNYLNQIFAVNSISVVEVKLFDSFR